MSVVLQVQNLEKYYGNKKNLTHALKGINFSVNHGEFVGIMGSSGSGKTTLLNCISTIDTPTSGHVFIDNQDITTFEKNKLAAFRRDSLGFIFQDFHLLDSLTVFDNIALALTIQNIPSSKILERVTESAKLLNISDVLSNYPYEISGGQKQRTACARAIISNPSLILADEPTGALDSKTATSLLESFSLLSTQKNTTILMVTHDAYAASFCQRILFIRDGKIFQEIRKGNMSRLQFFDKIVQVITFMGEMP